MKKKPVKPVPPQRAGAGAPLPGGSGAAVKPRPKAGPPPPPQGYAVPGHGAPGALPGGGGAPVKPPAKKPAAKKKPVKPKPRKLALGESVACCSAEALAASLRLTGRRVSDADVLALYERTAGGPDTGASILATLEAACEFGLAGLRPLIFQEVMSHDADGCCCWLRSSAGLHETRAGLILGMDLPGPHALLADRGWWWSWGEPYDPAAFPGAVIEEAWEIRWPR